ncbi:MAG: MBOAT family O-acyltransferase [Lachnospiraceae bacterium]
MLFSSIPFLYYFLPSVLMIYYIVPERLKNGALLLASLIFYAWGEPKFLFIMLISILSGYFFGILIERYREHRSGKVLLIISAGISLGFLGYFKYADFLISNLNLLTGAQIPLRKILLPIGISFYTFQMLSYTIDVYRGEVKAQKNFVNLALYITMFPQLIAGPIVRYSDIAKQLERRTHRVEFFLQGTRRFLLGLGKKILISNALGELCDIFRTSQEQSVLFFWIYAVGFALHIYFDFSGYSDMAIGLGKMFGFRFPENFDYPYLSKSVTEFWRRWHRSLGTWFRDYVYIPLGGNRVSRPRWLLNLLIVWMLTGLWHGAAWNFAVWGLFFAMLLILEKLFTGEFLKEHPLIGHVYVLLAVVISFVIFNAADMREALRDLAGMFGLCDIPLVSGETLYYLRSYAGTFLVAVIGSGPWIRRMAEKFAETFPGKKTLWILEPCVLCGLLLVMTAYLVDGSFNPFLYFRF